MLSKMFSENSYGGKEFDISGIVSNCKPEAKRIYDQIYMMSNDMMLQAKLSAPYMFDKKVAFLGDGDGMGLLFALLMKNKLINKFESIDVFDFDIRLLNGFRSVIKQYKLDEVLPINCIEYNVIDIIPDRYRKQYDYFYINPPYGSKNKGDSCIAWLYRCITLCKDICSGCIILPYDKNIDWTVENMSNIQKFLLEHNFVIRDMVSNMHRYHLQDAPDLQSATIFVDKVQSIKEEYLDELLPIKLIKNLYGDVRSIPKYIKDDNTKLGSDDFSWNYGDINNLME